MLSFKVGLAATYDWVGGTSTAWTTPGNWKIGSTIQTVNYPGNAAGDIVRIGVVSGTLTRWPVISATLPNSIASITIGTIGGTSPSLTVNSPAVLTVTGDITYTTSNIFTATLAGTGTINANDLFATTTSTANSNNTCTLTASITTLTLSGNVDLTTTFRSGGSRKHNMTFSFTGTTLSLAGIKTTNANAANISTFSIGNNKTLNFTGGTSAQLSTLSATGTNTITLGTGLTIGYTGNVAQTVYTNLAIPKSSLSTGISYTNLTLSGSGIKTTNGTSTNNLNISGNFTNSLANDASNRPDFTTNSTKVFFNGGAQSISTGSGLGTTFRDVTFSGTGIKTVSGNMNVTGNFTNSLTNNVSNYIDFGTNSPSVSFNGGTQSLVLGSGNGVDFKNVTFTGSSTSTKTITSGKLNVMPTGVLTIAGTNTTLTAGSGLLTLKSDANGSAAIAAIPSGGSITGTVNVERYISGGQSYSRGFRLLSSPVSLSSSNLIWPNLTFIHSRTYTTGTGGATNGFDAAGNPTMYLYRENKDPDFSSFISGNSRGVSKINNTLAYNFNIDGDAGNFNIPAGNGLLLFFRGDRATTTNPTNTSSIATTSTFTHIGYLNQGNITVKNWFTPASSNLSYTDATPISVRGFNLVGNPYASSINWDSAVSGGTDITNTIWIYNPTLKTYATYIAGTGGIGTNFNGADANIIPSGQGFYVKSTSTLAALTFTEAHKVSTQVPAASLLLATSPGGTPTPSYLRLQVVKDNLNKDEALVFFKDSASTDFIVNEDAEYLRGNNHVVISTQATNNFALAINQLALPTYGKNQKIPLNVIVPSNGDYQIIAPEVKNIPNLYDVWLMDAYLQDSLNLKTSTVYNFNAVTTDTTTFKHRFSVVIRLDPGVVYNLLSFKAIKVSNTVQVDWITENESTVTKFTIERSIDNGITYFAIGNLISTGVGNYTFIDQSPVLTTRNIYRLKQEDFNGNITYSKDIPINFALGSNNTANSPIQLYPNPSSSIINIVIPQNSPTASSTPSYTITIVGSAGRVYKTASISQSSWQGDISELLQGVYYIQVIDGYTKKLIGTTRFIKL